MSNNAIKKCKKKTKTKTKKKTRVCADLKKRTVLCGCAPRTQQEVTDWLQLLRHHPISCVWRDQVILPGELGHSLQEPGGVAVQRHGGALEASRCSQLSPPLLPWTRTTCGPTELTSVGRRLQRPPSGTRGGGRGWTRHSHCARTLTGVHSGCLRGHLPWKLHGSSPSSQCYKRGADTDNSTENLHNLNKIADGSSSYTQSNLGSFVKRELSWLQFEITSQVEICIKIE